MDNVIMVGGTFLSRHPFRPVEAARQECRAYRIFCPLFIAPINIMIKVTSLLGPSIHKFDDEFIHSGLSAERVNTTNGLIDYVIVFASRST